MAEQLARRGMLTIAMIAASLAGFAQCSASAAAESGARAEAPVSLVQRAGAAGAKVVTLACDSFAWTTTNLSPSALKARTCEVADAAQSCWMDALFVAQCELESTLGLFEVESVDGQGRAHWQRIPANRPLPHRIVLLIHGLDDPGDVWDDAAPAIWLGYDPASPANATPDPGSGAGAGCHVVRFDYPNDQPIGRSADLLVDALQELRAAGAGEVDIVAHSMGGLIARDALSRPAPSVAGKEAKGDLPRVERLILLGTPNHGSYLAHLRWVMEFRDCVERFALHEPRSWPVLLTGFVDGAGEAGADLLPDSAYLNELNSRPPLRNTRITLIEGDYSSGYEHQALELLQCLGSETSWLGSARSCIAGWTRAATRQFGDGAVPVWSIPLEGVEDHVIVDADHRSMISRQEFIERVRWALGAPERRPPAIAIILDRLASPPPAPGATRPSASVELRASDEDGL